MSSPVTWYRITNVVVTLGLAVAKYIFGSAKFGKLDLVAAVFTAGILYTISWWEDNPSLQWYFKTDWEVQRRAITGVWIGLNAPDSADSLQSRSEGSPPPVSTVTHDIELIPIVAQGATSRIRHENNEVHDLAELSDIIPSDSSSFVSTIADRYTRSMLECMAGYPLYSPEPFSELSMEYMRNGVNVGDVGFNGSINPPNLPDGFSLETPEQSDTRAMSPLLPETDFMTPTVTKTESGEYICLASEGTVLTLPDGAIQQEATSIGAFEDLARRHGARWYEYAMARGRYVSNGSLCLVTSFTKCTQWGIAFFDRPCRPGQGLTFVNSPIGWKGSGAFFTKVSEPHQGDTPNQCVFIRGYKIAIRQDMFDNISSVQLALSSSP